MQPYNSKSREHNTIYAYMDTKGWMCHYLHSTDININKDSVMARIGDWNSAKRTRNDLNILGHGTARTV